MNIIVLPTELTGLNVSKTNVHNLTYDLSYYYANECIDKDILNNAALEFVSENEGIGDETDNIYDKFIPLSKVNFTKEKDLLGFHFDITDTDYADYFVASELVYQRWYEILRFEQSVDYKIRSLIDYHGINPDQINALSQDCAKQEFKDRSIMFMTLMCDLWDANYYSLSDNNIVWGVGYSELGALFHGLENHIWLENNYAAIQRSNNILELEGNPETILDGIQPYPDTGLVFSNMIDLMRSNSLTWVTSDGLELLNCSSELFHKVNENGLTSFDFCIRRGLVDLA